MATDVQCSTQGVVQLHKNNILQHMDGLIKIQPSVIRWWNGMGRYEVVLGMIAPVSEYTSWGTQTVLQLASDGL